MARLEAGLTRLSVLMIVVVGAVGLLLLAMRFADGPVGPIAGGEFTSGERHVGPEPDWSFVKDRSAVEFQLLYPPRSRTTWILEHDNRIYIPCGFMDSAVGQIWKQWPLEAEEDGRALLRVDGVLYDRELTRIREGDQLPFLLAELGRKYLRGDEAMSAEQQQEALADGLQRIADESLWIFEMRPRS